MARPGLSHREARHPIERAFQWFIRIEAAGGLLLLGCAVVALIWANSPLREFYAALWSATVTVGAGPLVISKSLLLWINDGLMAIFFFVVGLELKREVLVGELASPRQAALPLAAAAGGMLVPAATYAALNWGGVGIGGWGIPMATDIAFALGVLTLLGSRAPLTLKIFLTALAIVDDLGAVLVIALFYTAEISWMSLAVGGVFLLVLIAANRLGAQRPIIYVLLGIGLWVAFLMSGVHATIAGVLLALTIPARQRIDAAYFRERAEHLVELFAADVSSADSQPTGRQRDVVGALEEACQDVETPLMRLEHALHPWVAFFIMPVFALANAGVGLNADMLAAAFGSAVTWGVVVGLVLGKQLGVTVFAWAAVKMGWAALPADVTWRQVYGVAWLTGIGFTMSLFIGGLAFDDPLMLDSAKIGILAASLVSGIGGWILLSGAPSASVESGEVVGPHTTG